MTQTTQNDLQGCLALAASALQSGYRRAQLVWVRDVVFDPRTRIKCLQNTCTHYGRHFMCPPNLPGIEAYQDACDRFRIGLLVQDEINVLPGLSPAEIDQQFKIMSCRNLRHLAHLEQQAFRLGFSFTFSAGGGACKLCDPCQATLGADRCAHPDIARPSMEAIGIDVAATCDRAGLPSDFRPERLLVTGLLFII